MTTSAAKKTESIFKTYEKAAKELVGGLTKTRAIQLNERRLPEGILLPSMRSLYESLSNDGWKEQNGNNWVWRNAVPQYSKNETGEGSPEVSLEREVAALDLTKWTCQMSTSSGVQDSNLNKRRAIDLVRRISDGRYAFIELKVGSNNPLYAAFEILGYALAYLHARGWQGAKPNDVLKAERIELTVLGPEPWYKYNRRGNSEERDFNFEWLADEIAPALTDLAAETLKEKLTFSMEFRRFSGTGNVANQAREIHGLAADSWWKD